MRFLICLINLFIINTALAGETDAKTNGNKAPVVEAEVEAIAETEPGDIYARLEKVEKSLNNTALLDMLELLESLKVEVSTLRGELELQTHTVEQLKKRQRDLYTDVDNRLGRIESSKTKGDEEAAKPVEEVVAETDNAEPEKEVADPAKAEAEYHKAFKLLKESQYDQAHAAFKGFLEDYPDSPFSDNAQYWLGETNYVLQKYELAINEYQALLSTFPDSKKVSHALLKIGYSYDELGNADDAKKTLNNVKTQYPGTTAARLADERLREIGSAKEPKT